MTTAVDADAVFARERPRLQRLARGITRSTQDAEDVVQDVWLRYATHRGAVADPSAWLHTVTSRAAIDCVRRRTARRELPLGPVEQASHDPGADELALRHEEVTEAASRLLTRLSALERAVVVGREFCALGYADLAVALGRSEPAVRQLRHRAAYHLACPTERFVAAPRAVEVLADRLWRAGRSGRVEAVLDLVLTSPA